MVVLLYVSVYAFLKIFCLWKVFVTLITYKWSLSSMCEYMTSQGKLIRERFLTYCAFKIPYLLSVYICEIFDVQKLKLTPIHHI